MFLQHHLYTNTYLLTVAVLHKKRSRPLRFPVLPLTPLLPLTEEARDELSAPNSFAIESISRVRQQVLSLTSIACHLLDPAVPFCDACVLLYTRRAFTTLIATIFRFVGRKKETFHFVRSEAQQLPKIYIPVSKHASSCW